jgi:MFS family permease
MSSSLSTEALDPVGVRPRTPLGHRNFRLLAIGTTTSSFGDAITPVALAFAVLELGGSAVQLGLVVGAFALAEVLTALFGGVLGDRVPRERMMAASAAGSAAVQAVAAATLATGVATIALLTGLGALTGVLSAFSRPSSQAMTPLTVPAELLSSAVAMRRLAQNTAMIAGFSVAGLIVGWSGSSTAIAVDAMTFAIAAVCFAALRVPRTRPDARRESPLRDMGEGLREVLRHRWLVLLIGQALLYHLFYGGAQGVLGPIVVGDQFGALGWGWALAALMVGFLVGGLVCLRWRPRHGLFVGTAFLSLTALFPLAMATAGPLPLVLLGAFAHGFGLEVFSVNWDLSIQQNVPADRLARVYSFDLVGSFVARPVGLALTGPVAEAVGYRSWLVVVGTVMGGSALLSLLSADVRRLLRRAA